MDFQKVTEILLKEFEKEGIDFAFIGGFALHSFGITRATKDIDFLISRESLLKVKSIMDKYSYELVFESDDVANFWNDVSPLGNVDFLLAHRKYATAMLNRAEEKPILEGTFTAKVVIPEDIVGLKVRAMANDAQRSNQDMADIKDIFEQYGKHMNINILKEYFQLFNQEEVLNKLLQEGPDNAQ